MNRREKLRLYTAVVCTVILLGIVLWKVFDRPYSENAARRMYEKNQQTFDTLGAYFLQSNDHGCKSDEQLETIQEEDPDVSEEVLAAIQDYLTLSLQAKWHQIIIERDPYVEDSEPIAVMFRIYSGVDDQTSYGGEYVQYSQYLVYAPEDPDKALNDNPLYSFQEIIEISEDWYLVMDLVL